MPVLTPSGREKARQPAPAKGPNGQRWLTDPEVRLMLRVQRGDGGEAPSRPLERDEVAGVVRAAVAGLAGRQRLALELHQFQDRTYAEVAAELDMTPKAAKSLLYRARNQLRVSLAPFMT